MTVENLEAFLIELTELSKKYGVYVGEEDVEFGDEPALKNVAGDVLATGLRFVKADDDLNGYGFAKQEYASENSYFADVADEKQVEAPVPCEPSDKVVCDHLAFSVKAGLEEWEIRSALERDLGLVTVARGIRTENGDGTCTWNFTKHTEDEIAKALMSDPQPDAVSSHCRRVENKDGTSTWLWFDDQDST